MKVDGIPQRSPTVPTDKTFTFYYRTFQGSALWIVIQNQNVKVKKASRMEG